MILFLGTGILLATTIIYGYIEAIETGKEP